MTAPFQYQRQAGSGINAVVNIWHGGILLCCIGFLLLAEARATQQESPPRPAAVRAVIPPEVAASRELWTRLNVPASQWQSAAQRQPWSENDAELLLTLLEILPRIPLDQLERLSPTPPPWRDLQNSLEQFQGGLIQVSGTLTKFENLSPMVNSKPDVDDDAQERQKSELRAAVPTLTLSAAQRQIDTLYRCELSVADVSVPIIVYVRQVPQVWLVAPAVGDRVSFRGVFLKHAKENLIFAAHRATWYPNTPLGKLDFDIGLLDSLRQHEPLSRVESEPFYQLLRTAGKMPPTGGQAEIILPATIQELWKMPEKHVGEFQTFRGVIRGVTKIPLNDPELMLRLGFADYYQLELKLYLPDEIDFEVVVPKQFDLQTQRVEAQKIVNIPVNALTIVYCCRELPPGSTPASLAGKTVQAGGYFLKSWRYQSEQAIELDGNQQRQTQIVCPLIVGRAPYLLPQMNIDRGATGFSEYVILGLISLMLLVALLVHWQSRAARRGANQQREFIPPNPL